LGKRLEDIPRLHPDSPEEAEREWQDPEFQAMLARYEVPKHILEAGRHEGNALGRLWDRLRLWVREGEARLREQRAARTRAELETAKLEERRKQDAVRLEAERQAKLHERNIQLLKRYGDIASISVGAGVLAAVVIAIVTHLTNASWSYANNIEREGYPPLWLWAGIAAAIATAGTMYRWHK
jgi:hypothetical protein